MARAHDAIDPRYAISEGLKSPFYNEGRGYTAATPTCRGAGKARFNVATPTYATVTCTAYVLLYNLQTKSI